MKRMKLANWIFTDWPKWRKFVKEVKTLNKVVVPAKEEK